MIKIFDDTHTPSYWIPFTVLSTGSVSSWNLTPLQCDNENNVDAFSDEEMPGLEKWQSSNLNLIQFDAKVWDFIFHNWWRLLSKSPT